MASLPTKISQAVGAKIFTHLSFNFTAITIINNGKAVVTAQT
jgi:hypothetical protein